MGLTDPELDLMVEVLEEDPDAEQRGPVIEALVQRGRWSDLVRILRASSTSSTEERQLMARASLEIGEYDAALTELAALSRDPATAPENARLEILALERSERFEEARAAVQLFLEVDPRDIVVCAAVERLRTVKRKRAADPFYTARRAEQYVDHGRTDRAIRAYRRIQLANPHDEGIEARLQALLEMPPLRVDDDLSVELTDPGLVPEQPEAPPEPIAMPEPRRYGFDATPEGDNESTEVFSALQAYAAASKRPLDDEDEETQLDLRLRKSPRKLP